MKVRDSGMPEQTYWEGLFNIPAILDTLAIDRSVMNAAEVGCGYGTFTLPVARRIRGTLHAYDIEGEMVETTRRRAQAASVRNVTLNLRDVETQGFGLEAGSVDAVLLFNILHTEHPVDMLCSAASVLSPSGRVLAIHWRSDIPTPRGPALEIRPRAEQIAAWATSAGLRAEPQQILPPWHFGMVLRRESS